MGRPRQLQALMRRVMLGKLSEWQGSIIELLLPIGFASLLILLKDLADVYDSPNVAYSCGPARPFDTSTPELGDLGWLGCYQRPELPACPIDTYYQSLFELPVIGELAGSLGYLTFLSFTVSDELTYEATDALGLPLDVPSLTIETIVSRLFTNGALLAVAPETAGGAADAGADAFITWLQAEIGTGADPASAAAVFSFASEAALETYILNPEYDNAEGFEDGKVGMAIVFQETDEATNTWRYAIRGNFTSPIFGQQAMPTVACLYNGSKSNPRPCGFTQTVPPTNTAAINDFIRPVTATSVLGYSFSGYLSLQHTVDRYILEQANGGVPVEMEVSVGLMPTAAYTADNFFDIGGNLLGLFFMLMFLFPVSRFIRAIVLDKEKRIKETMKIMGLKPIVIDISWFLAMSIQMVITAIALSIIISQGVYTYSNPFLVFLFIMSFSMSIVTLCFLLSVFFSKSKAAASVGPMLFFALYFPYYAVEDPSTPTLPLTASCIFAPTCMAVTASVFTQWESGLVGVQLGNVFDEPGNISFARCILMLLVDFALYGSLAIYFDKVLPSEFGVRRHWAYPLIELRDWCRVCCGGAAAEDDTGRVSLRASLLMGTDSAEQEDCGDARVEPVGGDLYSQVAEGRCVVIRGLRKEFSGKVAVDGLTLEAFEGQITVLLGHNGAGKTTTISMVTGLIAPSGGQAIVRGKDISTEMNQIRHSMGVCPQHDVLFPELNVRQHLEVFAAFKNVPHAEIPAACDEMISRVGLKEKARVKSSMLSGGQKRKLSVGIALIGDSKTVILDEPSSGMDPYSRRSMWDLLQEAKAGRVVMLTTHFMDEADILGDRIAIMGDGKLRCCGSSLFLKREYGVGYSLSVLLTGASEDRQPVAELIESLVPAGEQMSSVGAEVTYRLPFEASTTFRELFSQLEIQKSKLGVAEYGLSVTTLEEVFLLVASAERETGKSKEAALDRARRMSGGMDPEASVEVGIASLTLNEPHGELVLGGGSATSLFCGQFGALFTKRYNYAKRDLKNLICQVVVPAILVFIGLMILTFFSFASIEGGPELVLISTEQFNTQLDEPLRNYVPIRVPQPAGTSPDAELIAGQFDMNVVKGQAVLVGDELDAFEGCAQPATDGVDPLRSAELTAMSDFLLSDENYALEPESSRYGAVTFDGSTVAAPGGAANVLAYNVLVNATAVHAAPMFANLVNSAMLRVLDDGVNPGASITVSNKPLPLTELQNNISSSSDAFSAATYIMIAFAFLPASYAI